jgi:hypothetical protein
MELAKLNLPISRPLAVEVLYPSQVDHKHSTALKDGASVKENIGM